jgi:hypothetical protein
MRHQWHFSSAIRTEFCTLAGASTRTPAGKVRVLYWQTKHYSCHYLMRPRIARSGVEQLAAAANNWPTHLYNPNDLAVSNIVTSQYWAQYWLELDEY